MRALALVLGIVLLSGCGGTPPPPRSLVHADGRIGPFRLDVTTEAQLRAKLGNPEGLVAEMQPAMTAPHGGRTLVYVCGKGCLTEYSFNNDTKKLADFWTQSARWSTERGSYPGMPLARAAELERTRVHEGCSGDQLNIRMDDRHAYVLFGSKKRVAAITYLGPNSTYYDGLC
jgi:hypothetical protein